MFSLAFFAFAGHGKAQEVVDLALVLAVDSSGSINNERYNLQMDGYAAAFRDPKVHKAIASGLHQAVAVTMVHWSAMRQQTQVVSWHIIRDAKDAETFAAAIKATERTYRGTTAITEALEFSTDLLTRMPFRALRKVIDISGDGSNDYGPPIRARDHAISLGITINGLPIISIEPTIDNYYQRFVVGGPGAFLVVAKSFDEFPEAVRKKLILEIAGEMPHRFAQVQ